MSNSTPTKRRDAAEARQRTYLGTPCHRGHGGLRYTATGNCVECSRYQARERYAEISKLLRGD